MKILHTYHSDVAAGLRQADDGSLWHQVEPVARETPGWVAFLPEESVELLPAPPQPQAGPVNSQGPAPTATSMPSSQGLAPATALLVADTTGKKPESLARIALPFFAVVVGLPLLLWYVDKKKERA